MARVALLYVWFILSIGLYFLHFRLKLGGATPSQLNDSAKSRYFHYIQLMFVSLKRLVVCVTQ